MNEVDQESETVPPRRVPSPRRAAKRPPEQTIRGATLPAGGPPHIARQAAEKAVEPGEAVSAAKIPVEQASLHSAVLFQGFTAETWNEAKMPGVLMLWVRGEGLLVGIRGKETLIPAANVKNVVFKTKTTGRIVE